MTQEYPIWGFRQDRIGARLICLLDMLRISERFGVSSRYLWLSQPDGPYPELSDPAVFLGPTALAAHVTVVDHIPDRSGREVLRSTARNMNSQRFAQRLAGGERFLCDSMAELIRFMDEPAAAAAQQVRRIFEGLELAPQIRDAMAHAREKLAEAGGGQPIAIHVRRGDILDSDPWSYSCWPSKYVPDEFFRAFAAQTTGPVIAFSDTPAAVTHLAQGDPRIVPVAGLFDDPSLSAAQRDMLELLLMGGCYSVGAPVQSAFSQAASIIGGARIIGLPHMLAPGAKQAASDALLDRVIGQPDSFFAPGDLAQSVTYASAHAIATGRAAELVDALADRSDFMERFPFVYRELAVAALAAGLKNRARRLARHGLTSDLMRSRDKPGCQQVLMVLGDDDLGPQPKDPSLEAQFVSLCFTGRAAQGLIVPALAHRLLSEGGPAAQALMFDPRLVADHQREGLDLLAQDGSARQGMTLPLWVLRSDWLELVTDQNIRRTLLVDIDLGQKLTPARDLLAATEAALAAGETPQADDLAQRRLGFCAAQLRLHGRLKRAFALLHWLDGLHPGDALTHKRLADACFTAGNAKAGWRWLNSAEALMPENALLKLSAAMRASETGDADGALTRLQRARQLWPDLELTGKITRRIRKLADPQPDLPKKRA